MKFLTIGLGKIGQAVEKQLKRNIKNEVYGLDVKRDNFPKELDFVIICFSSISHDVRRNFAEANPLKNPRFLEEKKNRKILKSYIKQLKRLPNDTKIILVSNPVDKLTNYLQKKLPNKDIFGFGLQLDKKRLSKQLGRTVDCIGVHGDAIPLIKRFSREDYLNLKEKAQIALISFIKKKGLPSIETSREIVKLINKLSGKSRVIVDVCYKLDKPFYGIKNKSVSLPFIVEKGRVLGPKKLQLNNIEIELFKEVMNK